MNLKLNPELVAELTPLPKRLRALWWGLEYSSWLTLTGPRQQDGAKYLNDLADALRLTQADLKRYAKI